MFYFLIGLLTGLSFLLIKNRQIDSQLNEILHSLSHIEHVGGLTKLAQVRRKVNILNEQFEQTALELEKCSELIDKLPLGYLRISQNNCLVDCNNQAQKLLNIKRWESNSFRFFLELVRSYELDQLIQQTRKTQKKLVLEWQFFATDNNLLEEYSSLPTKNDRPLSLKAHSYPLREEEIAIFIEDQQLIKDLIARRDQAYSDLSHELRTPLTSILLLVETLLKYTDQKNQQWVEKIYQEINRLIDLVQNWLAIYQLEKNPYEILNFQELDLPQLIISAWKSVEMIAAKADIALNYQGVEKITISADINCLTQVFVNLFDNSIKYCERAGVVKITTHTKINPAGIEVVEINVVDSGVGFDPDDLPHIFERLYRGDKSRTRQPRSGSGLGLSIVRQIIENHQGSIVAHNNSTHPGACFQITLPLHPSELSSN